MMAIFYREIKTIKKDLIKCLWTILTISLINYSTNYLNIAMDLKIIFSALIILFLSFDQIVLDPELFMYMETILSTPLNINDIIFGKLLYLLLLLILQETILLLFSIDIGNIIGIIFTLLGLIFFQISYILFTGKLVFMNIKRVKLVLALSKIITTVIFVIFAIFYKTYINHMFAIFGLILLFLFLIINNKLEDIIK